MVDGLKLDPLGKGLVEAFRRDFRQAQTHYWYGNQRLPQGSMSTSFVTNRHEALARAQEAGTLPTIEELERLNQVA